MMVYVDMGAFSVGLFVDRMNRDREHCTPIEGRGEWMLGLMWVKAGMREGLRVARRSHVTRVEEKAMKCNLGSTYT